MFGKNTRHKQQCFHCTRQRSWSRAIRKAAAAERERWFSIESNRRLLQTVGLDRNQQQRRQRTAQNVRDALDGLKIPDYIDRDWCDQIYFDSVYPEEQRTYGITNHAQVRMSQRGISKDAMAVVLKYGRRVHAKNVIVYFFGKKGS